MKVIIDHDLCQGHGVCEGETPRVFNLGDKVKVELLTPHPPAEEHDKVRSASNYCPTRAIQIIEEP